MPQPTASARKPSFIVMDWVRHQHAETCRKLESPWLTERRRAFMRRRLHELERLMALDREVR
jgi:hypothetical protein